MQRLCLLLLVLFLPGLSQAGTYYVQKTGSGDGNPCTVGSPCLTINRGIAVLGNGDTLIVRSGIYDELIGSIFPSGCAGTPTILRSEVPLGAIIRPSSSRQGQLADGVGLIFFRDPQAFITIDGFVVDAINLHTVMLFGSGNQSVVHDISILNCEIKNGSDVGYPNSFGISQDHHNYAWRIAGNHIHHIGADATIPPSQASTQSYGIYYTGEDGFIENNEIDHCGGFGIHQYDIENGSSRNVIRNNIIHDNGQAGILYAAAGSDNLLYNNIFYGNANRDANWAGVNVGIYGPSNNNKVYNNTLYGNAGTCIRVGGNSDGPNGTIVQNNNCSANGSDTIGRSNDTGTVADHNFCQGAGCSVYTSNPATVFVNAPGADFHLQSGSPAIDVGVNLQTIFSTDIAGAARGTGSGWDVGAYEFGLSLMPPPTRLRFTVQPQNTSAGQIMAAVVVQAQPPFSATVTNEEVLVSGCPQ
jgi:parallel beta-helix repeat protein